MGRGGGGVESTCCPASKAGPLIQSCKKNASGSSMRPLVFTARLGMRCLWSQCLRSEHFLLTPMHCLGQAKTIVRSEGVVILCATKASGHADFVGLLRHPTMTLQSPATALSCKLHLASEACTHENPAIQGSHARVQSCMMTVYQSRC